MAGGDRLELAALVLDGLLRGRDAEVKGDLLAHGAVPKIRFLISSLYFETLKEFKHLILGTYV